jgi:23S rRNA (adenine2503-C2)-methyltransferase
METRQNHMKPIHIHNMTLPALRELVLSHGEPEYRYRQLATWLYARHSGDFESMTDLPTTYRESLSSTCRITEAEVAAVQQSRVDGTRKFLFELRDGARVESVLMRYEDRTTLCVSSQVGCPLDCVFCETAKGGFGRNLTAGEIIDQVCALKASSGIGPKKMNIVFMGMGEPLLNIDAVTDAIGILNHPLGFNLGAKRVTVSTSSFPDRIRALARSDVACSLALSLNASDDETRTRLMPKASRFTIAELLDAARAFVSSGRRRVTLEYVMLRGINMSDEDARRLGHLTRREPFKINLIPYNPGRGGARLGAPGHDDQFDSVSEDEIDRFVTLLQPLAPAVTVRRSRGVDIDAACGQLWTNNPGPKKRPVEGTT